MALVHFGLLGDSFHLWATIFVGNSGMSIFIFRSSVFMNLIYSVILVLTKNKRGIVMIILIILYILEYVADTYFRISSSLPFCRARLMAMLKGERSNLFITMNRIEEKPKIKNAM